MLHRGTTVVVAAGLIVAGALVPVSSAAAATATLTVSPLGWNIVGLDSNAPTGTTSPARYAVGAKVCNTSATTATGVTGTWAWGSTNANITVLGSATKASADLAAGACRNMWWTVDVARLAASFNTARQFRITASATNAASVLTPANREIYVEKLISQARNNVTGSSGPTSVYVGGTYTWTFSYDTGTFNQVMAGAFLDPSIFEIQTVSQTYSTGGANAQFYYDACGWKNDSSAAGYRSCTTNAKVGGTISSTVTATVTGTGTSKISPLVLDFSGSSYHYNTDYASSVYALTVTATAPPAPTAAADSASTPIGTTVDVDVLANDTAGAGTLSTGTLAVATSPSHGTATVVAGKVRYVPAAGYAGPDSFTYTICNSFGVCATGTVSITVSAPPAAADDSATAPTAVPTLVDVLGNDSSPAGWALTVSSVSSPTHGTATISGGSVQYTSAAGYQGPDSFSYTVSDGHGGIATATVTVSVVNTAPDADDDSASTTNATPVLIDVRSNDTDANGDTLTISAVGSPSHGTAVAVSGQVRYTPAAGFKGVDQFTYTVSDGHGGTATATVSVTVANAAPVAAADDTTTPGGTAVDVDVLGNDTDPNGDALTISNLTDPAHGSVSVVGGVVRYVPDAGFRGDDTFTYTATDGTGTSAPVTVTVSVGNTPPAAQDDSAATHSAVTIDVLGNDSDANSDTLVVTGAGPAAHGTVVVNADGTVTYNPDAGYSGPDSFTYTVSDGFGGTSTATVSVTVTNIVPVANDDDASLAHGAGASITVDVLANDTDADGDTLSLALVGTAAHGTATIVSGKVVYTPAAGFVGDDVVTYTVSDGHGGTAVGQLTIHVTNTAPVAVDDAATTATGTAVDVPVLGNDTDAEDDTLSVATVGAPSHGTVVANPDGTITYTPDAGYRGPDSFAYTVTDGWGTSAPATVSITVLNAAPVAQDDTAGTPSGTPIDVVVLDNDSDANGDALSVTVAGPAAHGTVVINPDGSVTYTPTAGYKGADSFSYTITDGLGGTSTATVSVTVGGAGPIAADDVATTLHGVAVAIDVLGNDSDPNPSDVLGISSVGAAGHGSTSVFGGQVLYVPDAGFVGEDTFTYVVTDFDGGVATATVTVTVTNLAPTTADDEVSTLHGVAVSYDVLGNDSDADGDTVSLDSVGDGAHGTAAVVAGQVVYTPDAGYVGDDTVTYVISDGVGGTATGVLAIHVTNSLPTAVDDEVSTLHGVAVSYDVLGNDSDPDGDTVSLDSVGDGAHGTAAVVAGQVVYTPDAGYVGDDTVTYVISDGVGGTATGVLTVHVTNTPPTALGDSTAAVDSTPVVVDVLGNDSDADGDSLTITVVGAPSHGSVVITGGAVTYTSVGGYEGPDSFTYTISDGHGGTSTATVSVTVFAATPPPTPTLDATASSICVADAPYVDYTATLVSGASAAGSVVEAAGGTVTAVWRDADGTVVMTATGLASSGRLLWPGAAVGTDGRGSDWPGWVLRSGVWVQGPDGFERTRTGSTLELSIAAVTGVTTVSYPGASSACAPAPRLATAKDSARTAVGEPVTIGIGGNDSGVDSGAQITITGAPGHGTVVVNPDGTVTYTPDDGFVGEDSFVYTVTNADGSVSSATVVVTVDAEGGEPQPITDQHPQTGADVTGLLGLGLLLLLAGAALRRAGRRTTA